MDDPALLRKLARNLDGSFENLVLEYQDCLYRFALRLSGSPRDAEEIAQDAFVRAYYALGDYPPDRITRLALRAWLYQITLNVFRNRMRRKRLATVPLDDGVPLEAGDEPPEHRVEIAEQRRELAGLLASLPERYRVAVVLRHIEELDYAEIAYTLGRPEGTIKSNVHRGLRMLRDASREHRIEVTA